MIEENEPTLIGQNKSKIGSLGTRKKPVFLDKFYFKNEILEGKTLITPSDVLANDFRKLRRAESRTSIKSYRCVPMIFRKGTVMIRSFCAGNTKAVKVY